MEQQPAPLQFGSRRDRDDAALIDQMVSFACKGKLWTLVVEDAKTTTYRRRGDERYLRTRVMIGDALPAADVTGELLPRHTPARVASSRRAADGSCEIVLVVPCDAVARHSFQAA